MFDSHEWLQHKNAAIRRFPIENPMEKLEHPINVKSFKIDSLIGAPNLYVICTKGSYTFFCVWREWSNKFVCFKIKFCLFLLSDYAQNKFVFCLQVQSNLLWFVTDSILISGFEQPGYYGIFINILPCFASVKKEYFLTRFLQFLQNIWFSIVVVS